MSDDIVQAFLVLLFILAEVLGFKRRVFVLWGRCNSCFPLITGDSKRHLMITLSELFGPEISQNVLMNKRIHAFHLSYYCIDRRGSRRLQQKQGKEVLFSLSLLSLLSVQSCVQQLKLSISLIVFPMRRFLCPLSFMVTLCSLNVKYNICCMEVNAHMETLFRPGPYIPLFYV